MTNRAVDFGIDVFFFAHSVGKIFLPLGALWFPLKLGHLINGTKMDTSGPVAAVMADANAIPPVLVSSK